jgi:pimeloyl-ACP methyl ester carboxylesterase
VPGTIAEQIERFQGAHRRTVACDGLRWRYYRLGHGAAVVLLPGGLRRAAYGFELLHRLAERHTVVAVDLPPLGSVAELVAGLDRILAAEGIPRAALVGQSYGGLLAQAYVACRPHTVTRLVLASTGPADGGRAWLPMAAVVTRLVRALPDAAVRRVLGALLARALSVPAPQRAEWTAVVRQTLTADLTDADVISHVAVVADMVREGVVRPAAYDRWPGSAVVLAATNDPTQRRGDRRRFEQLLGRRVDVISLGALGHTAQLRDPATYAARLEQALAGP